MRIVIPIEDEIFQKILHPTHHFPRYEISNYGQVRIKDKNKILKPFFDKDGYIKYTLLTDEKSRVTISSHRLVAYSFLKESPDEVVMHLDDNPNNNYYCNLTWGTQQENISHAIKHGRFDKDRLSRFVTRVYDKNIINTIKEMVSNGSKAKDILNTLDIPKGSRDRKVMTSLIFDLKNGRSHTTERNVQRLSLGGATPQ